MHRLVARMAVLALMLIAGAPPGAEAAPRQERPLRERGDFQVERDRVLRRNLVVEEGTVTVDGEVEGWVVVSGGDAIIRGTVRGLVVAVYGDVIVMGDGLVQGDAVSVSGDVVIRDAGVVTGSNITTTRRGFERQGSDVAWARVIRSAGVFDPDEWDALDARREKRRRKPWDDVWERKRRYRDDYRFLYAASFPLGGLVYNRVDGLTIQGEIFNSEAAWRTTGTGFFGGAGYALGSGRFYYRIGLNRFWVPSSPVEVGAIAYRQLETEDTWYMTPNENDWMALLARYDWYDYYLNEGFQVHLRVQPHPWVSLGVRYAQDNESGVDRVTNWALFGGDRDFRENRFFDPVFNDFVPAAEGEIRRIVYFGRLGTAGRRWDWGRPARGIRLEGWLEQAGDNGVSDGGDFYYERFLVQLQAYQRLSLIDHLALRVRVGSASMGTASAPLGLVPPQHRFYLGGVGSLRGYEFKEFVGNRLFLATAEYTIGTDSWSPIFDDWSLTLFYDYGLAWITDPGTGLYTDLLPEVGKRSYGIGVSPFGFDGLRVEIARPLDRDDGETGFVYYIRWSFDF